MAPLDPGGDLLDAMALRTLILLLLLAPLLLLPAPGTGAAEYRYPDLKPLPPADLNFDEAEVGAETHDVLRFTSVVWNAGPGKLELRGTTTRENTTLVHQRIYAGTSAPEERPAGEFAYHEAHAHWHFGDFAEYELWTRKGYDAWAAGSSRGEARQRGTKTTFCIMDSEKVRNLRGSPTFGVYQECNEALQGISVGYGDVYRYDLPEQWLDLGAAAANSQPLPDGGYALRAIADPDNRIFESAGGRDRTREAQKSNDAVAFFSVRNGRIQPAKR